MSDAPQMPDPEAIKRIKREARLEGAVKALHYASNALTELHPPADLEDMTPLEAFAWAKAMAETAVVLIGDHAVRGGLNLTCHPALRRAL